jgi:hypothetical protein
MGRQRREKRARVNGGLNMLLDCWRRIAESLRSYDGIEKLRVWSCSNSTTRILVTFPEKKTPPRPQPSLRTPHIHLDTTFQTTTHNPKMPLHLLGKKSWNVYAPDNIARVKRDEAEAAAKEEELDRIKDEHDAAVRLALLRGETPPPPLQIESEKPKRRHDERGPRDKKRRRVAGEDDTERDIRAAREDLEERHNPPLLAEGAQKKKRIDAPITDHAGHINLFPVDPREQLKNGKNAEVEAEKARKQRELEDQYTMRLSNAAGRDGFKEKPWYATGTTTKPAKAEEEKAGMDLGIYVEDKNVWGRPDPNRKVREAARISSGDPLAFMSKAQTQLKNAERDRRRWAEERLREEEMLKRAGEVRQRSKKRKPANMEYDTKRGEGNRELCERGVDQPERARSGHRHRGREGRREKERSRERRSSHN